MAVAEDIRPSSETVLRVPAPNRSANAGQFLRWMVLFLGGIVMVMPIAYMISTSLKWPHEVYNLKLIPDEPRDIELMGGPAKDLAGAVGIKRDWIVIETPNFKIFSNLKGEKVASGDSPFALADLHIDVTGQCRSVVFGDANVAEGQNRPIGGSHLDPVIRFCQLLVHIVQHLE